MMLGKVISPVAISGEGDGDPLAMAENTQVPEAVREEKQAAAYSGWVELFRPGPNF